MTAMTVDRETTWRIWGPLSSLGLSLAALIVIADQAHKAWMLYVYRIAEKGTVQVTSFFDLTLVWNEGISYGLFQQDGAFGRFVLVMVAVVATVALVYWLATLTSRLAAVAVGLIIGGAVGNGIDRAVYGAVADFFSLHAFGYHWYIFNIADVAIVAGVIGLLWGALFGSHKNDPKKP